MVLTTSVFSIRYSKHPRQERLQSSFWTGPCAAQTGLWRCREPPSAAETLAPGEAEPPVPRGPGSQKQGILRGLPELRRMGAGATPQQPLPIPERRGPFFPGSCLLWRPHPDYCGGVLIPQTGGAHAPWTVTAQVRAPAGPGLEGSLAGSALRVLCFYVVVSILL